MEESASECVGCGKATSSPETSVLKTVLVVGDDVAMQHEIPIQDDQIPGPRRRDGLVPDGSKPKALVGVPNVPQGELVPECANNFGGGLARTVIGDKDFVWWAALASDALETAAQRLRPVICADHKSY